MEQDMTDDLKVNELFYTPTDMDDMMRFLTNSQEPLASMGAMLMWNLIASGNHISKEDKDAD
jgi:hypothetical protein|tara:strand:+ start:705 stop:890 length:186 start_codon:yes stop_codon:yes gene_type:complete